jgi:hypothetical protein
MLFPVLPTAAEELPKEVVPILLINAFCPPLVSTASVAEDDTGKLVDSEGVDPNLKREVVEDEDTITGSEELLMLDAFTAGVLVVMLAMEVTVALMLLLVARDELLNIF